MKILVKEEIGYIKGYGRMSDVGIPFNGKLTKCGLDPEQYDLFIKQGFQIVEDFEEDKSIPPHVVGFTVIPKGTNRIYIVHPQLSEKV